MHRLSFVTEQVAQHTNGTIGALLNATFGNAPELLIAVAALRSGYYRIVQLAMLGSMLSNLLLIFGMACFIGGIRWQVQTLRKTSGEVSIGMLWVATAGSLLPTTLSVAGQMSSDGYAAGGSHAWNFLIPNEFEITLCRVNASVMFIMYLCYLLFQLETHKEEFDDDELNSDDEDGGNEFMAGKLKAQPNRFCWLTLRPRCLKICRLNVDEYDALPLTKLGSPDYTRDSHDSDNLDADVAGISQAMNDTSERSEDDWSRSKCSHDRGSSALGTPAPARRRRLGSFREAPASPRRILSIDMINNEGGSANKYKSSDCPDNLDDEEAVCNNSLTERFPPAANNNMIISPSMQTAHGPVLSLRVGILWLFIITLCISAMSDILVDTIDGFAKRMRLSEVFTSMVIIPFFSNIAEQVSAFIFAFRNEMDLTIGVTVGSAIQIATMVLPGSVLIGMMMDRSMTLYFHCYETVCLFFGVLVTTAVLQGGTTNWLTGVLLIGIYIMMAAGIWFHVVEDLTVDAEILIRNATLAPAFNGGN
jgi:Ca2+/H+ antiporter